MPDKPTHVEHPSIALPDHSVLALIGPDALAFAQAQTMNDVAALADGEWHWNGWLTSKGRVVALFALLRLDAQQAWLLLPDFPAAELADALRRYVFRSKLRLEVRDDLQVRGHVEDASCTHSRLWVRGAGDAVALKGWPGGRTVMALPASTPPIPTAQREAADRWREADLRAGLPRLDAAQSSQWTPQQLSLERLQAYSVKKGCYPGQEIVARTHFLGQAKRGLALLQADHVWQSGEPVLADGLQIGQVVACAGQVAQAVMPVPQADDAFQLFTRDGRPIERLALPSQSCNRRAKTCITD